MDRTDDLALPAELDAAAERRPEAQQVPAGRPLPPSPCALRHPREVIERAFYEVAFHAGKSLRRHRRARIFRRARASSGPCTSWAVAATSVRRPRRLGLS